MKSKHLHISCPLPVPLPFPTRQKNLAPATLSFGQFLQYVNLVLLSGVPSEFAWCQGLNHNCLFLIIEVSVQMSCLHL